MQTLDHARRFDLHLHTNRSDGVLEPAALLEACVAGGLEVVAVTDHDLAADLGCGPREVGGRELFLIAGAEISGIHEGAEYHLLVYFPHDPPPAFHAFCEERCRERASRYERSRERIGLSDLPPADDAALQGRRALTRHHLARALVAAGHAADVREAFRRYADEARGNVPSITLPFVEAIRVARSCGGVTSWAHPPPAAVARHLSTFVEAGLQGLEGLRPMIGGSDRQRMRRQARAHGLFFTGGSDWHGWPGAQAPGLFHVDRSHLEGFLAALEAVA